jgi:ABC-type amino acid transport substrate-binding protein
MLRLLALLFAIALIGAACGDDDDGGGDASGAGGDASFETIEEGTLTVCSDIPYAPFEFEEDGELKGIDIDLMKAIGEELDLDVEFASSVSITDERKENNAFTDGYFEINQSLLVRKGEESSIQGLDDLEGKTVGVQSETTGAAYAEERADDNGYEVKEFTGADELFTALKAKQVDAVLQDFPINSYNAEKSGDTAIATVFEEDEKEEYGFVVKKGNDALVDALNEALDAIRDSGRYDDILEEYLGEAAGS